MIKQINGEKAYLVNPKDISDHFWKNTYIVRMTYQGIPFIVNADYESAALDYIIDYCEEHLPGLVCTYEELLNDGYSEEEIDDEISGGNHCLYLMVDDVIHFEKFKGEINEE